MSMAAFNYPGHTEYLAETLGGKAQMIMVSDAFRVALVTGHVPLRDVAEHITKERVAESLALFIKTLKEDFGFERPKVAMLGLNPHASDGGVIGTEEEEILKPVLIESKKAGNIVMGPYSSDGFFGSGLYKKFDGILAMYHDQALIPFKSLSFGDGVNYTAGLSYIRTSPDHGTGYDLVGTDQANESSFRRALYLAIDLFRTRTEFKKAHENSLYAKQEES
jgi:4-hydroxythreonine-4-phosphate dehydrogenase